MTETIEWVACAVRVPDDGQTVLMYVPGDEPMCTAFVPAGDPVPPPNDDRTIDMFGQDAA